MKGETMDRDIKDWLKYEKVRQSGEFNMIMEAGQASKKAGLTLQRYTEIIKRYSIILTKLKKSYSEEEINEMVKKA